MVRINDEDIEMLDEDQQAQYRSGVGTLLYLVKHSQPNIENSVREHSKIMDRANVQYWESLLKLIKYVVQTRNKTLPKRGEHNLVNIEGFGDSKYGGNINTQKAVPGFIIYLTGAPISPRSKMQHSMTLL